MNSPFHVKLEIILLRLAQSEHQTTKMNTKFEKSRNFIVLDMNGRIHFIFRDNKGGA